MAAVPYRGAAGRAGVAQLVEHLICNQRVGGSNPFASSKTKPDRRFSGGCEPFATARVFPAGESCAPGLFSAVIPLQVQAPKCRRLPVRGVAPKRLKLGEWVRVSSVKLCRWGDCAQVAERLMAADCKSAAPWSYGGSNPPLCTTKVKVFEMRSGLQNAERLGDKTDGLRTGEDLQRRFPIALALYAVLALLVWFTMDAGKTMVFGRPVELRLVPLVIIAGLAVRTVLARQADRFRRSGERQTEKL